MGAPATEPGIVAAIRRALEDCEPVSEDEAGRLLDAYDDMVNQRDAEAAARRVLRGEVERLRGEVARMSAVVDAARTWRHGVLASGEECSTYALACAVDALDERSGR